MHVQPGTSARSVCGLRALPQGTPPEATRFEYRLQVAAAPQTDSLPKQWR